ncbi:MAG TPA: hypothetical protein ENK49_14145 [Gammaproteobacteria bacterium]|nr:hypothetical protein [Gammaproteobacteria bacterium]
MDEALVEQLARLNERDIRTRNRLLGEGRLYGQYDQELRDIHTENAHALDEIVAIHGWPTITKAGIEGTRLAWLVAQHAICTPDLQRKFYRLLSEAAGKGDAPERQVALLADRIRFNEGRPQIYGTVLDWNEQGEFTCELEDPETVDERRGAVGLPPFEQARAEQEQEVRSEGGQPPEDYEAHKNGVDAWAKSTGWR